MNTYGEILATKEPRLTSLITRLEQAISNNRNQTDGIRVKLAQFEQLPEPEPQRIPKDTTPQAARMLDRLQFLVVALEENNDALGLLHQKFSEIV